MNATARLAAHYLRTKGTRPNANEYATFSQWLATRFNRIRDRVDFTDREVTPEFMLLHWKLHGRLLVSTAHNVHPHWLPVMNAQFRAVHDWDHINSGAGFDLGGELQAFTAAAETAPRSIRWILYSEIVLQAATAIHTGEFARQKLVKV